MKKKEERLEKQMAEVMAENKRLVEPLQKAREEVDELRRQLTNYDKDKQSLAVSNHVLLFGYCTPQLIFISNVQSKVYNLSYRMYNTPMNKVIT